VQLTGPLRILMLGWEFPPFIAGGLGVACYGLTRALSRQGHEILFVLPRPVDRSQASHVRLLSPEGVRAPRRRRPNGRRPFSAGRPPTSFSEVEGDYAIPGLEHVVFRGVEASFSSPYPAFVPAGLEAALAPEAVGAAPAEGTSEPGGVIASIGPRGPGVSYQGDLVADADRYGRLVVALARQESFDVIHAHDWLTYPAGLAIARVTHKPLVVHVHSTEFDRAGENVNQPVYDIERRGMHGAQRVIAVSMLTKGICIGRYGVRPGKIDVVYNGVDRESDQPPPGASIGSTDRIVLFLGRITMQKGPEYFIAAARRVLEKVENVKFVIAGTGDMSARMIELAAQMGIGHKVLFTGFLRGRDVERVFRMADCYVMPSVSEPFGIAPLEAINNGVPVIISKQSGVSEVLTHVLKVDFWDVDEMANKIVAVLRHPPLGATLRQHGTFELRRLTWEGAAEKCVQSYQRAIEAHESPLRAGI
jgi:glycosyltransferase involved in cell wall biosynthesis